MLLEHLDPYRRYLDYLSGVVPENRIIPRQLPQYPASGLIWLWPFAARAHPRRHCRHGGCSVASGQRDGVDLRRSLGPVGARGLRRFGRLVRGVVEHQIVTVDHLVAAAIAEQLRDLR